MIRTKILAAAVLLLAVPAVAQTVSQDDLDARYDRALAAGYKALFLCSAIANAERAGATRTPESVIRWELQGIQAPLNQLVSAMPFEIIRAADDSVDHVRVTWDDAALPRYSRHDPDQGCKLLPIGAEEPASDRWSQLDQEERIVTTHPLTKGGLVETGQAAFGETYGQGTRTTAVDISIHGDPVVVLSTDEFPSATPTPQRTWSVAKSIAATLVGMAVYRGEIDVSASAALGEDGDPRRDITIDNLLRMASGRYSDTPGNRTDPLYFGGAKVEESATHWPLIHQPGSVYRYANNDTLMAVRAIKDGFEAHPPAELFRKLGMTATVAETDWQGDYILSSQVWSTARDLARLGQLYLDDGVLPNGERILPKGWVDYVSSPTGPQPDGPLGYGAGFWLFNKIEGVPSDTFAAMGNRGQYVVIIPSRGVVIVRRGEDPVGARFDIVSFTRDVLAALGE